MSVLFSASNFANFAIFCAVASVIFAVLFFVYVVCFLIKPVPTIRFTVWCVMTCFYRIRIYGEENVPKSGGMLLTSNHVSWLDGTLMLFVNPRIVRCIVYAGNFRSILAQFMAKAWRTILMNDNPKSMARAIKEAREGLKNGDIVGVFPEGGISRSGMLQSFRAGAMKILKGTNAPVIPMYMDGLWGSVFSFEGGKFFFKKPKRWRYPIHIHYGKPIHNPKSIHEIRQAVQALGAEAVKQRMEKSTPVAISTIKACKQRKFKSKIADSTGAELTGGSLLMRTLILRRLLKTHVLAESETHVGILLPPTVPAMVVNLAVSLDKRVAVNLNYTVTSEVMNACIREAGIRHVLTSRKVTEKLDLELDVDVVYLEDLKEKLSLTDKLVSAFQAYAMPASLLVAQLGLTQIQPEDVLTVIFTSGSTGTPKGVMLTNANIRHNVDAVNTVIKFQPHDAFVGILPFFHSFGYMATIWAVATLNIRGIYHFSPLDARQIGKLVQKQKGTILLSTPTFLKSFLRRCSADEFATLDTVVAGAEKLPKEVCDAFEKKFGVRPVEGYGTTELSPLVSLNIPASRSTKSHQIEAKEGTVGRPAPGVSAKVINVDTHEELGAGEAGMLLIKGANVMKGYMNHPKKTAEVMKDGWYVTGDIAEIDEDGFIRITGRQSRFSKIGGEMVPHILVEEALIELIGFDDDGNDPQVAVTAVPDDRKGERLIVIHQPLSRTADELCEGLRKKGLPNIYIPSADSFFQVDEVPLLGTGKLDLRAVKQKALELCGQPSN